MTRAGIPRPSRSVFLSIIITMALAFPMGVVLASHQFSDVPDSYPFHDDISALVDAGVTLGCGGGKYCPKAYVTREQMAAFLNRLGSLDGVATPSVDAASVDGYDATSLLVGDAPIPAGVTVTGYGSYDHAIVADNADVIVSVQLPAPAPANLDATQVNFAPNALATDDDATCTGTSAAPTAPAGKVCIYLASSAGVDTGGGYSAEVPGFYNRSFLVQMYANGAPGADLYFRFTWAYTAPSVIAASGAGDAVAASKE